MSDLNFTAIFSRLDEVTGLPLKRRGNQWYGKCYMDGQPHSRWNKTVARQSPDGNIQILEQGYKSVSLWNWMKEYGGCLSDSDVFRRLNSNDNVVLDIEYHSPIKSGLYVLKMSHDRSIKFDELFRWLCTLFPENEVLTAFEQFGVTSTLSWNKQYTTTFWYRDIEGRICHDKQIWYGSNGKRDKSFGGGRTNKTGDGYTNRCYFGEHLFGKEDYKNVYIVESEKTALLFWLKYNKPVMACGGLNNLMEVKHNYVLLPDKDDIAVELWSSKGNIVKWWESYELEVPHNSDIGDLIVKDLELEKLLLSL